MSGAATAHRLARGALVLAVAAAPLAEAAAQSDAWRKHEITVTLAPWKDDASKGVPGFRVVETDPVLDVLRPGGGVLVAEVYRNSATDGVVQRGDIITAASALPMRAAKDFEAHVHSFAPGTRIKLELWRYGEGFARLQAALYRRAQENDAGATYALGYFQRNSGAGEARHAEAFGFFHRAAALGHVRAMEMTAHAYRDGRGTDKNPTEAAKWYRRAADAGSAMGAFSLGMLIATGQTGPMDAPEAFRLMQRAAAGGIASAHYLLANYLDIGRGTGRDREAAARHFVEAARNGSQDALTQFTAGTSKWKPSPEFISALQRRLQEARTYSGPVDGQVTPELTAAFARLQPGKTP